MSTGGGGKGGNTPGGKDEAGGRGGNTSGGNDEAGGRGGNPLGRVATGGIVTCDEETCGRRLCSAGVNSISPTVLCIWDSTGLESKGNTGRTTPSSP